MGDAAGVRSQVHHVAAVSLQRCCQLAQPRASLCYHSLWLLQKPKSALPRQPLDLVSVQEARRAAEEESSKAQGMPSVPTPAIALGNVERLLVTLHLMYQVPVQQGLCSVLAGKQLKRGCAGLFSALCRLRPGHQALAAQQRRLG